MLSKRRGHGADRSRRPVRGLCQPHGGKGEERAGPGVEPIERRAERAGEGEWEVRGLIVPVSGRWQVSVDVLVSDFEKMRLDGDVTIAP
jgi:hypothetical protein